MRELPRFTFYKTVLVTLIIFNTVLLALSFIELYHVQPESKTVYVGTFSASVHIVNRSVAEKYYDRAQYTIPINKFEQMNFNYIALGGPFAGSDTLGGRPSYYDIHYYLFGGSSPNRICYATEINGSQIAKPIIDSQHFLLPLPPSTFIKMTPIVKGDTLYFKVQTKRDFARLLIIELTPISMFVALLWVTLKVFDACLKVGMSGNRKIDILMTILFIVLSVIFVSVTYFLILLVFVALIYLVLAIVLDRNVLDFGEKSEEIYDVFLDYMLVFLISFIVSSLMCVFYPTI